MTGKHKKFHEGKHVWVPGPKTTPDAKGDYTLTYECARSGCPATITKKKNTDKDG